MEPRGALFRRNVLEQTQQLGVVVGVGRVAGLCRIQRGKARRMHARRAVQHVHLQTRIVGQNEIGSGVWRLGAGELALQPLCKLNGLFRCIAGKSWGVLDDFRRAVKIVEREKLKPAAEDGADFTRLVDVARGDEQRNHVRTITAARWICSRNFGLLEHFLAILHPKWSKRACPLVSGDFAPSVRK